MGIIFDHYPEGGGELLTILKLADNAHDDGSHVYPSVQTVAEKTHQSPRTVQRHLQAMLENGWLVLTRKGGRGPGDSNEYRIPVELLPDNLPTRVTNCHPSKGSVRVTSSHKKGDKTPLKGDTAMSPEPSIEPSYLEPSAREARPRAVDKSKKQTRKTQDRWWETNDSMVTKAGKLGLNTHGLSSQELRRRINDKLNAQRMGE